MDEGEDISIFLTMSQDSPNELFLQTQVVDKGIGIPEAMIGHLNRPEHQDNSSESSIQDERQKTGTGLATAKTLAKA